MKKVLFLALIATMSCFATCPGATTEEARYANVFWVEKQTGNAGPDQLTVFFVSSRDENEPAHKITVLENEPDYSHYAAIHAGETWTIRKTTCSANGSIGIIFDEKVGNYLNNVDNGKRI